MTNHLLLFGGFNEDVLPGVSLLSLWRLSGFPVESAILFGPGLSAMMLVLNWLILSNIRKINDEVVISYLLFSANDLLNIRVLADLNL